MTKRGRLREWRLFGHPRGSASSPSVVVGDGRPDRGWPRGYTLDSRPTDFGNDKVGQTAGRTKRTDFGNDGMRTDHGMTKNRGKNKQRQEWTGLKSVGGKAEPFADGPDNFRVGKGDAGMVEGGIFQRAAPLNLTTAAQGNIGKITIKRKNNFNTLWKSAVRFKTDTARTKIHCGGSVIDNSADIILLPLGQPKRKSTRYAGKTAMVDATIRYSAPACTGMGDKLGTGEKVSPFAVNINMLLHRQIQAGVAKQTVTVSR